MNNKYLLDASAILALLQKEKGSEVVGKCLPCSAISSVNLAEVASVLNKLGMPESEVYELINAMDIEILDFEKGTAIATGGMRNITQKKGLSLGDRACLATAKQHKRIALTADKAWLEFQQDIGVEIKFIR
ncbi:type II toxin-antitoxin system VapC family toxin [Methyloprofundus sp.]|uniref:type II toxin-antitoxin system VapC family toxin n=1 Tax=Methyloprofundus sp. TaxID=2020875 RepID=UPI003D12CCC3